MRAREQLGLVAGVDQQRAVGAVGAQEERVLLERPDGEGADVHGYLPPRFFSARWRRL